LASLAGARPRTKHAVALGYSSLYNHEALAERQELRFTVVRDVAADEELTINYNACGGGPEWHNDNWFDRMRISPVLTGKERAPANEPR